ncbi:phenylacetate--CoA ligase family protein [Candidatus Raskinella chloraquaticus]|uniref:AMP-dependent synthetase n=2 Tax=Pseudomonadota TaxID=1224 RepID=A0A1W9HUS0_9HYPH|nr:MAG: AMP-dependent synthetase [Proteobacteria bacterium SG_bin8]
MTPDHFDRQETREPIQRERAQFKTLRALLSYSKAKAPQLRQQIKDVDPREITSRSALAQLPVLRKSDLLDLQTGAEPFGGLAARRCGSMSRLFLSPGPIAEPEGSSSDWWGAARALFAAGFRKNNVILNTFSYHMTPGGFIMDSGARALGCAVVPSGPGNTEQQMACLRRFEPDGYVGVPDFLKILIEKAAEEGISQPFDRALVSGAALTPALQKFFKQHRLPVYQAYATADLGVVAYESDARQGLIINETVIVEIVRPGTGDVVEDGEVGEVVVTRLNQDYPLLRFATGDLSKILPGRSSCGRSNQLLAGWLGRADQATKVKGMFVHPGTIVDIMKRHAQITKVRLVVSRKDDQDVMTLHGECANPVNGLADGVASTLREFTKMSGIVKIVAAGSLPNDGRIIADERADQ